MQPLVSSLLHDLVGQTEQEVPSMSTGLGGSEDRKVTQPRISKQNLSEGNQWKIVYKSLVPKMLRYWDIEATTYIKNVLCCLPLKQISILVK